MSQNRQLEMAIAWYQACVNVVSIFGETEVGGAEPNHYAIVNYMSSIGFVSDAFDAPAGENAVQFFEEQLIERILNGFPVWRFLKLSPWAMEMMEKSFVEECDVGEAERKRTYCCLRCEYLRERGFGYYCDHPDTRLKIKPREFDLKKKCRKMKEAKEHVT